MSAIESLSERWARIRGELERLPEEERTTFARRILADVGPLGVKRKSIADLRGILATDGPPPTDDEVQRILEEERMLKYGG